MRRGRGRGRERGRERGPTSRYAVSVSGPTYAKIQAYAQLKDQSVAYVVATALAPTLGADTLPGIRARRLQPRPRPAAKFY
jgi:hypothetical protein